MPDFSQFNTAKPEAPAATFAPVAGGGGGTDFSQFNNGAKAPAAAKGKGGGLLGSIKSGLGSIGRVANPLNLVKGITHIAGEVGQNTGLTPSALLDTFKHVDPFYHSSDATKQKVSSPAANALLGNAAGPNKGERGLHVFAQQSPTLYQAGRGLERTVHGVPDIAVNAAEDVTGHGPGLANSIYGRDIHEQGVAPWLLQQAGNVAILAGGAGALGKAAGFGNATEAARLEGLAARAVSNVGEKGVGAINTAEKAQAAAEAARAAGDVSKAAEYESAAANLAKAQELRAAVTGRGAAGQAAEQATAGAKTVTHFGNQVAGAPAELYTKLVPKLADVASGGRVGALASDAAEAARTSGLGQRMAARGTMKELFARQSGEEQRLANPVNSATAQIKRLLPDEQDQMAAYLARSGDAGTVLPHLAGLPDAEIQAVIDRNPFLAQEGVTPDAIRKAADYVSGALPADAAARFDQAHQLMEDDVYGPKAERHVTGYGDKAPMNPVKQAQREAAVAGRPGQMAVDKLEAKLTAPLDRRLAKIESEVLDIRQRNLDPQTGDLTPAAAKQIARDEAVAKSIRRQVAKEEARQGRVAAAAEKERARVEGRGNSRIGQVAGRARETMAEQSQLREGLAPKRPQLEAAARRTEKVASQGEKFKVAEAAPKGEAPVLQQDSLRQVAADEARARADQLKGVGKPKTRGEIQRETSRAAGVANARTAGEAGATERLTGAEAGRQESALQAASRQLASHEETAGARAERLQSDAAARAFRNDQNRLASLHERRIDLETKRAAAVEAAPNHPSVQAPQVRSLLSHAKAVAESLTERADELEATDPALAAQLRAAAEAQPKTPADVADQAKYISGGKVPEGGAKGGSSGARIRSRVLTSSERAREGDVAPLTAEGQRQQVVSDLGGRARNELPRMVQHELGSTAGAVATEHGLEGEALAAHLKEQGYTAWDPEGSGGKLADHKVTADSPVLPTRIMDQYQRWNPTKNPGALAKVAETINKARIIKLLSTGFPLHKMGADMLLDMAVAGVNPFSLGEGAMPGGSPIAKAVENIRNKTLPADVGVQTDRPIEPGATAREKLANVPKHITQKGMMPFRMIDTANRDILYRTLIERGLSPQTAAEVTKQAAGDLQGMSPSEKAAGRALVTYYPWQRHLADVAKNVVAGHPAGLAEAAALAQADAKAHPDQVERRGELADFMNPMGNFVLAPGGDVAGRIQGQLNPLLQLGAGALAGVNLRKGEPLTTPQHPFGASGATGPLVKTPGNLAGFALHTLVPQVGQIQDAVGKAKGPAGFIPYRQDTGQPETKKGKVQAQPGTTKLDAIARLIGFPHAEKAQPPKKAKKKK